MFLVGHRTLQRQVVNLRPVSSPKIKEEDRSKDFRNKPRKKLKLDHEDNVDCLTKINVGVMITKDVRLSIKRG